jgi:RimJ/RimL family protein N-acetyltransferase
MCFDFFSHTKLLKKHIELKNMLIPFDIREFNTLNNWIDSRETIELFAGYDWKYPLTTSEFEFYKKNNPTKFHFFFRTKDSDSNMGFAEIITQGENTPRIGRLILDPNLRGKGYGSIFIKELIQEAKQICSSNKVYLYVFEDNTRALKTYLNLGFIIQSKHQFEIPETTKTKTLILMSTF